MKKELKDTPKQYINEENERILKQVWIDTNGRVHRFKGKWHESWDLVSLHEEIAQNLHPDKEYAGDYLFNLGWVKCYATYTGHFVKYEPTQAQINTLFDMGIKSIVGHNDKQIKIF